jgi:RNA polymerase sigma factor (sigma-70 family)
MPASLTDEDLLSAALAGDERAFGELYRRWQGPMFRFARQMCGADGGAEDVVQEVFVALIENGQQFDPARGPLAAYLYGVARYQARRRLRTDGRYTALDDERGDAEDDGVTGDAIGSANFGLGEGSSGHRSVSYGGASSTGASSSGVFSNSGSLSGSGGSSSGGYPSGGPGVWSAGGAGPHGNPHGNAVVDLNTDASVVLERRLSIDLVHRLVLTLPVAYREALVLCDLHELGYAEAAAALGCPVGTVRSRLHRARALLAEKVRSGAVRRGIA